VLCDKLSHMRFEPSGWSGNPKIGYAKSLMDYVVFAFMLGLRTRYACLLAFCFSNTT